MLGRPFRSRAKPVKGRHVLVLHPDADMAERLSRMLSGRGYVVTVSRTPIVEASDLHKAQPDIVLVSDTFLGVAGEPLAAWIRRAIGAAIVGVCDSHSVVRASMMLENGADDVITPAQSDREVMVRIERLIQERPGPPARPPRG